MACIGRCCRNSIDTIMHSGISAKYGRTSSLDYRDTMVFPVSNLDAGYAWYLAYLNWLGYIRFYYGYPYWYDFRMGHC